MPLAPQEIELALKRTLADHRLSRGEQKLIRSMVEQVGDDPHTLALMRSQVFDLAAQEINSPDAKEILGWVEEVVKAMAMPRDSRDERPPRVYFSPNDDCPAALGALLRGARRTLDICVFTITDDRVSDEIAHAHGRGVQVRILTDDDKSFDPGSDIGRLTRLGITVRQDSSPYHMHHKFALIDRQQLVSGSYNWTRGAAEFNQENFIVSQDPTLLSEFQTAFDRLWGKYQ